MIPLAPTQIILQTGNGKNLISWNQSIGATSYSVQRSTDGITFSPLGTSLNLSYVDSTCLVGVNYFYQVASVNGSGTSNYATPYPLSITPCLPGQINLAYLRYMATLRADKLNSQYLTLDEWNFNINQSATELYDLLVDKFGDDYFFAPPLVIPLTGLSYYPIPDGSNYPDGNGVPAPALYKLNGIDGNVNGTTIGPNAAWTPLARFNWADRDRYSTYPAQAGALNNLVQLAYRQMGSNIFLIPPNINMSIQLWYVPILRQMLLDTDMLPFSISGWSEFIIVDAAMKAMVKEESEDKWNILAACKAALIERIEVTAANRDVGQPNTISNTRATMGDPGFSPWGYGGGGFGGFGGVF